MIVPSHFVPLAAPGMVALGLKWMWNPGIAVLHQAAAVVGPARLGLSRSGARPRGTRAPCRAAACAILLSPVASCFEELAALRDDDFGLSEEGIADAVQDAARVRRGSAGRRSRPARSEFRRRCSTQRRPRRCDPARAHGHRRRRLFSRRTAISSPRSVRDRMQDRLAAAGDRIRVEHRGDRLAGRAGRRMRAVRTTERQVTSKPTSSCCAAASWSPSLARELGLQDSDAGRQRLQPHAAATTPVAGTLRDPQRGRDRGDADGRRTALRRNDGDGRAERGRQPRSRARHHRCRAALLSAVRAAATSTASRRGAACVPVRRTVALRRVARRGSPISPSPPVMR